MMKSKLRVIALVFLLGISAFGAALFNQQLTMAYTCQGNDPDGRPLIYKDGGCYRQGYDTRNNTGDRSFSQNCTRDGGHVDGNRCYIPNDDRNEPVNVTPRRDNGDPVTSADCSGGARHIGAWEEDTFGPNNEIHPAGCWAPSNHLQDGSCGLHDNTDEEYTEIDGQCYKRDPGKIKEDTSDRSDADQNEQGDEQSRDDPGAQQSQDGGGGGGDGTNVAGQACGGAETALIPCTGEGGAALGDLLGQVVAILTAAVGAIAVGGIIYGAILYTSAQDNASQVTQAIGIMRNVAIGVILYLFMITITNWLVPGGVI